MTPRPATQECPKRGPALTHVSKEGKCPFCGVDVLLTETDSDDQFHLDFRIPGVVARRVNLNNGGPFDSEPLRRKCSKCNRERECYMLGTEQPMCVLCVDGTVNSRTVRNASIKYRSRGVGIFKGSQPDLEMLPESPKFDLAYWHRNLG